MQAHEAQTSQYLLEVENLVKYFPITGGILGREIARVHAVDGVSFKLRYGRTLGLVGESGCGKSTLGRTILKLFEPTAGKIIFEGQDITNFTRAQMRPLRRKMQIVFQDPFSSLDPRMTIGEILSEPLEIHKIGVNRQERTEIVRELLKEVGLHENAIMRYPHEFSGGQRQRIGIARALALKPQLIVADEPVSALDVSIQSQVLNLLAELREKYKLSYIFVAHDLAVIEHISDEVCVMYLGRVVEHAEAEDLYARPMHPYTRALIASIPIPKAGVKRKRAMLQGDVPSPVNPPPGCRFHTRCAYAKSICSEKVPELKNLGTDERPHWVACHFAGELPQE